MTACSDPFEAKTLSLKLQTQRSSRVSIHSSNPRELSLHDPVDLKILLKILSAFFKNPQKSNFAIRTYHNSFHSASAPTGKQTLERAYVGGVYDPSNNQILFIPDKQAPQTTWHRYDCSRKTIEDYQNPFHSASMSEEKRIVLGAYHGGVYDPINHQIVFSPIMQAPQATWHRYDCSTQKIEEYFNPFHSTSPPEEQAVSGAYVGGVYDPINHQIVFIPYFQANQSNWHRYNCLTKTTETYPNPFHSLSIPEEKRIVLGAYLGGVYDPIHDQIVFVPYNQANQTTWHRYDCSTQTIEEYLNPFHSTSTPEEHRAVLGGYHGGAYDSLNNQIVFAAFNQAPQSAWHRYNCVTRRIEAYENPFHSSSTKLSCKLTTEPFMTLLVNKFCPSWASFPAHVVQIRLLKSNSSIL
jgi:hypothetical protein